MQRDSASLSSLSLTNRTNYRLMFGQWSSHAYVASMIYSLSAEYIVFQ